MKRRSTGLHGLLFLVATGCAGASCSSRRDDGAARVDASTAPGSEAGAGGALPSEPFEGDSGGDEPSKPSDPTPIDDGAAPRCEEPLVRCGSSCVRLEDDPHHCGGCNHDCQGLACAGGTCPWVQVVPSHSIESGPAFMAAEGEAIAWTYREGSLSYAVSWRDTASEPAKPPTVVQHFLGFPPFSGGNAPYYNARCGISLQNGGIIWGSESNVGLSLIASPVPRSSQPVMNDGGVDADSPADSGGDNPFLTLISTPLPGPSCSFLLVDQTLYFAWGGYGLGKLAPGTTTVVQLLDSSAFPSDGPDRLAQHGAFLYWAEPDTGKIVRAPLAGGEPPKVLLAHQARPSSLLTDGTNLYWINVSDDTLMVAPLDGSVTKVLIEGSAQDLQLDGPYLYWFDSVNRVLRMPKLGGKATVLAKGPDRISAMAVGSRRVFWINAGGDIWATAK